MTDRPDRSSLADQVIVIVGGGGDIGFGTATLLVDNGAHVVLVDRDNVALEARLSECSEPSRVSAVVADVTDPLDCERVVAETVADLGRLDALVNAAMVSRRGSIDSLDPVVWNQLLAVNLSAVYYMCRSVIPVMRRQGGGIIVNMGSIAALRAMPSSPAYAAAKGGVVALSRSLALDHAREGIRVFSVNPPAVDTRLFGATFANEPDPAVARARYESSQPGGRVLRVEEVAATIMHLVAGQGPPWTEEPLVL